MNDLKASSIHRVCLPSKSQGSFLTFAFAKSRGYISKCRSHFLVLEAYRSLRQLNAPSPYRNISATACDYFLIATPSHTRGSARLRPEYPPKLFEHGTRSSVRQKGNWSSSFRKSVWSVVSLRLDRRTVSRGDAWCCRFEYWDISFIPLCLRHYKVLTLWCLCIGK